jgi:hypothetical protein
MSFKSDEEINLVSRHDSVNDVYCDRRKNGRCWQNGHHHPNFSTCTLTSFPLQINPAHIFLTSRTNPSGPDTTTPDEPASLPIQPRKTSLTSGRPASAVGGGTRTSNPQPCSSCIFDSGIQSRWDGQCVIQSNLIFLFDLGDADSGSDDVGHSSAYRSGYATAMPDPPAMRMAVEDASRTSSACEEPYGPSSRIRVWECCRAYWSSWWVKPDWAWALISRENHACLP